MRNRAPLTLDEKTTIYHGKLAGMTLSELADQVQCSLACARKWWRIGRGGGLDALKQDRRRTRRRTGTLARFDPMVAMRALHYKRMYPRRGAERILDEMKRDEHLRDVKLPACSTLAAFFKARCPELLQTRQKQRQAPSKARRVHECWQIDAKENIRLGDGSIVTVLTIREPVACAFLGCFPYEVTTKRHYRKLTANEIQQALRTVFTEYGLPQAIQTDRERVYGTPPTEAFPTRLSLWLAGLGINHVFGRPGKPTDQPQVERGHRTWHDWLWQDEPHPDLKSYRQALDQARHRHNYELPSHAGDCQGRTPYETHPEVSKVQRAYEEGAEPVLFCLERVDRLLARHRWSHRVTGSGQVSIGRSMYYVGVRHGGLQVEVCFDPDDRHFVFLHWLCWME